MNLRTTMNTYRNLRSMVLIRAHYFLRCCWLLFILSGVNCLYTFSLCVWVWWYCRILLIYFVSAFHLHLLLPSTPLRVRVCMWQCWPLNPCTTLYQTLRMRKWNSAFCTVYRVVQNCKWRRTRRSRSSACWPRSSVRTAPFPSGYEWERATPSGSTPSEGCGAERSLVCESKAACSRLSVTVCTFNI